MEVSNNQDPIKYQSIHQESINEDTRVDFWLKEAKEISWTKAPTKENALKITQLPFIKWFSDGELNACYNLIDRHVISGKGNVKCIVSHCAYTKETIEYTYSDVFIKVNILSKMLLDIGITKGDRVIIYMPMLAESLFAMLACTRIGAVHCVVFGGFAVAELSEKMRDCGAKAVITASCGIEPRKKILYYPMVVEATKINKKDFGVKPVDIILVQRKGVLEVDEKEIKSYEGKTVMYNEVSSEFEKIWLDKCKEKSIIAEENKPTNEINENFNTVLINLPFDYEEFKKTECYVEPLKLNCNDSWYILYTSGTIGSPKGILRDYSSLVTINYTMKNIMDIDPGEAVFSTSDIGWIVGHVFIVYGPLLRGATTVIMEGKPLGTPDAGKCWEIIEKYRVKAFYTAPTALRMIRKSDQNLDFVSKYDISSLESLSLTGERSDPETFKWIENHLNEKKAALLSKKGIKDFKPIMINDHYWQTESGYPICCNNVRICKFASKPGSSMKPIPGFDVTILSEDYIEKSTGEFGMVAIKLPTPPGFMTTLFESDEACVKKYYSPDLRYYIPGDSGYFDKEGDIHIMARNNDIIKIAGHRLSTGRLEEVMLSVPNVSEVGIAAYFDSIKGEVPCAFVVLSDKVTEDKEKEEILTKAKNLIVKEIGAISRLKDAYIVKRLPKTKSGKIVRGLLRQILNTKNQAADEALKYYKYGETVENKEEIVNEIKEVLIGVGLFS